MRNGLLIDTGPLIALFYGEYDKQNGTTYLREKGYSFNDYQALEIFMNNFRPSHIIITPHIFHELWKHAQKDFDKEPMIRKFFECCFNRLIGFQEKYIHKNDILTHSLFIDLEIGEHSLICSCLPEEDNMILHDDRKIDGKFRDDKKILTINLKEDLSPFYLTNMS